MTPSPTTGRMARTSRRPAGSPPRPRPAASGRGPAGLVRRGGRGPGVAVGVVAGVLLGLLLGLLLPGTDSDDEGPAREADPVAERVVELQQQETARDAEAVTLLTAQTTDVLTILSPVVLAAGEHGPGAPPPSAATVQGWRAELAQARQRFGDAPSAGTQVNLARAGLLAAVADLQTMVSAMDLVADAPAAGADVDAALEVAASARRAAALAWSVGATQLDAVTVAAGEGHVHLFLPPVPDSGALTADPEAQGR